MASKVAVVGAGAAGAAATYALRDEPVTVTVFEKSGGVCGRAATRRREGCTYEYGANYLKSTDERVTRLVTEELPDDGLVDVTEPVWTFDEAGTIEEGRDGDEHKWTYERGITQLAKRLFDATDATVHRKTRVQRLERTTGRWRVIDSDDADRGRYDAVVLTPPAPQTADLLGQSRWEHDHCRDLREAIASIPYRTIVATVLHYPFEFDRPYYALVNEDKNHDIGWIGREECKAGHVPDGESLLLVQMAPEWSADRFSAPTDALIEDSAELTAELLDDQRVTDPDWTDHQRWRYALPDAGIDSEMVDCGVEHDLFLAGDWVAGEPRLHAAVRNGLETGERLAGRL
ncbi:MAG: NAD(P)/FAD-dependent oxidoreductase [Haloarculaceae archaeon]